MKIKKIIFSITTLVVISLVGWGYFGKKSDLLTEEKVVETSTDKKNNEQLTIQNTTTPSSLKIQESNKQATHSMNANNDESFEAFDRMEKSWLEKIHPVIGERFYTQYLGLKEQNDKEKMKAYKEYHDYLRQKYGDKFSYNISDDQTLREKSINQRYENELLKLIGPEKFKIYVATKDQFNEDLRRANSQSIQIEF
jgi:hypothetical protein